MRGEWVGGVSGGRRLAISAALAVALSTFLAASVAASASAATPAARWTVDTFAAPTDFSQATGDAYTVTARNAGSVATNGEPVTLTDALPPGLRLEGVAFSSEGSSAERREDLDSDCTSVPLRCTFTGAVAPDQTLRMIVSVSVAEGGVGGTESLTNLATVSGGGAPQASASTETAVGTAAPPFGVASFETDLAGLDGMPDTQAGGHPYELTATVALNNAFRVGPGEAFTDTSVQDVRDFVIELPLGFLAGALATPQCTFAQLTSRVEGGVGGCPPDTAVGHLRIEPEGGEGLDAQIYNMAPEQGAPAEFAYVDTSGSTHALYTSVAPTPAGYVLRLTANELPQVALTALYVTFFGDPAAKDGGGDTSQALLTNPSDCSGQPLRMSMHLDSWQDPGSHDAEGAPDLDDPAWVSASSQLPAVTGCEALADLFEPSLAAVPQRPQAANPAAVEPNQSADSPTGLELELKSPTSESPEADATPPLERAVVTLPEGLTIDPSAGDGLQACSEAQVGWLGDLPGHADTPENFDAAPPGCPDESKIGSLELTTPLFSGVLTGSLYLAAQDENPFQSTLAAYLVVDDPTTGVVLKIPAELRADPHTGRLTVVLPEAPQLPFSDLKLHFFSGPRALLATPDGCGTFTTTSELTPWSTLPAPSWEGPNQSPSSAGGLSATPFDSFTIDEGCASGFAPSFTASGSNVQAGAYSPFEVSISREDAEAELGGWSVSLPPGLLADVGAVPLCGEAQANAGTCPESSQVGTVLAEAGPGPNPLAIPGKAYLTGPYNGGPFGLSVVVPVITGVGGPFNFGTVAVRQSLRIDPSTAQITDVSNPFPTVLDVTGANGQSDGIPIRLRSVDVDLDRPGFTFNPTSCDKLPLAGTISSVQGASVAVSSPFQVTDCGRLKFAPKLTAGTRANGEFAGHGASLHIVITTGTGSSTSSSTLAVGQTNLRSLKLDLPQRLPTRLTTLQASCRKVVFTANPANCPASSVVGTSKAMTPVLGVTMVGPAYFVSNGRESLPDIDIVLQGDGVRLNLRGSTFVSKKDVTSVTFRSVPDIPLRSVELTFPEGRYSALGTDKDLCRQKLAMPTAVVAQNGAEVHASIKVGVSGCARPKHHKK